MTIHLSQIDAAEPLATNAASISQQSSDDSFEEKLKYEKARLGLLYAPFAQMPNLFGYLPASDANWGASIFADNQSAPVESSAAYQPAANSNQSAMTAQQMVKAQAQNEAVPLPGFSQQATQSLQDLLLKTNWLVPNLEGSQQFYQSFLAGKLQPSLDLQSLVDQIADQLEIVKSKGKTELSLTLKPAELGNILLTLSYHQGLISVSIMAQPEAKKLIDESLEDLEAALKKAHINFDEIQIKEVTAYGRNV